MVKVKCTVVSWCCLVSRTVFHALTKVLSVLWWCCVLKSKLVWKSQFFLYWKSQSNLPRLPRGVVNNRLSQASILKVNSNWGAISNIDWRTKRYLSAWDSNVSITCAVWFWNSLDLCILVNTWCIVNIFDWTHNTDRHITNWSKIFW